MAEKSFETLLDAELAFDGMAAVMTVFMAELAERTGQTPQEIGALARSALAQWPARAAESQMGRFARRMMDSFPPPPRLVP